MKDYINSETSYKPRGNKSNYNHNNNSSYGRGFNQQGNYKYKNKSNYVKESKYPDKPHYKSNYHNKFDNKHSEKTYDEFAKPSKFYASKLTRTHTHSGNLKENVLDYDNQSIDKPQPLPFKPKENAIPENLEVRNTNNYYKKTDNNVISEPRFSYKPDRSTQGYNQSKGFNRNVNLPESIPVFFKSEKPDKEIKNPNENLSKKDETKPSEKKIPDEGIENKEDVNISNIAFLKKSQKA